MKILCSKCLKPANNGTRTLCNEHADVLRENIKAEEDARIETVRKEFKYYIPDYTDVGEGDRSSWTGFQVVDAKAKTIKEFLENLSISEIDQDGGEIECISFDDAPMLVQSAILRLVGLTWDDVSNEVY